MTTAKQTTQINESEIIRDHEAAIIENDLRKQRIPFDAAWDEAHQEQGKA